MSPAMVSVKAARALAAKKYDKHFGVWAAQVASGGGAEGADLPVAFALPLHPPTESAVLTGGTQTEDWVRQWRATGVPGLAWVQRRWASVGVQTVPDRLVLAFPRDVAAFAGQAKHWRTARARAQALLAAWPDAAAPPDAGVVPDAARPGTAALPDAVRRHCRAITALPDVDFDRLLAVLEWLVANPESGMYIRQLPIRGVDSKWVGSHRGLVKALFTAVTGRSDLGLAEKPPLVRVRFLDPTLAPGGLVDVSTPLAELIELAVRPRTVFVFENLESVIAMPQVPGAVVIHGGGYGVDALGTIPWVRDGRVVYWGDLDSHGFAILNQLRTSSPHVTSVLMDRETLEAHRDLWGTEPAPSPGILGHLTCEEQDALTQVREEGNIRLEQERLGWAGCVAALEAAARTT